MRVILVTGVFPPEPMVSAQTSEQIAEELVRLGHSVLVLAPYPNRPQGVLFEGYKRALSFTSAVSQGYELTYCFGFFSPKSTILSRLAENLSFGVTSGLRLLCSQSPDVVYSNSWPIFATGIVACIARLRGIPLVISIQDIYPESLESQGRTSSRGWIFRFLQRCDRAIVRSASQVIVISERFRELYEKDRGVDPHCLHLVPNWGIDDVNHADYGAASLFRHRLGIPPDAFVAVYAGNVGVASNAEMLVGAFAKLRDNPRLYLVIAGDGSRREACRKAVEEGPLGRVIIHTPWKTEETGPVLQMADVLLLPTKGNQSLNSVPSKLITYLLSGRPVIAAVLPESDTAIAILGSGAGWVIEPDSADLMAKTIAAASKQSKESLNRMGMAGREFARQSLTRDSNLPRIMNIVEEAAKLRNEPNKHQPGASPCQ